MLSAIFFATKSSAQWSANTVAVNFANVSTSQCYSTELYLYKDYDADGLADFGAYLNTNLMASGQMTNGYEAWRVSQPNSSVTIKTPLPNMIYKIFSGQSGDGSITGIDNTTFWRSSYVFPYNTPVRLFSTVPNLITFEQPSDGVTGKNAVTIQYNYAYRYATGVDTSQVWPYRYNRIPDINYYGNTQVRLTTGANRGGTYGDSKRFRSSSLTTKSSCRNMNLHRCGDGYIDSTTGRMMTGGTFAWVLFYDTWFQAELCDDGALNWTLWYCDVNCGRWGGRCWDEIINDGWTDAWHGPTYTSGWVEQFEECDFWDTLNGSDMCTSDCAFPVIDQAVDEAVNE